MKAKFLLLPIFSVFIVLNSWHKDRCSVTDYPCYTWDAKTFFSLESVAYLKNENKAILLTFKKDGTYSLMLDINSCGIKL